MNPYDMPNSAYQISNVMKRLEEEQKRQASSMQDSIRQRDKFMNAQLNSASDLRKMLEMMEANQKEQKIEGKKTKLISIWGLIISGITLVATIIFGMLQVIR